MDWIKALPAGVEPDFVLVSCSGAERQGLDVSDVARIVGAKRRGEDLLRSSGLGYTVIRPGPLVVSNRGRFFFRSSIFCWPPLLLLLVWDTVVSSVVGLEHG